MNSYNRHRYLPNVHSIISDTIFDSIQARVRSRLTASKSLIEPFRKSSKFRGKIFCWFWKKYGAWGGRNERDTRRT